MKLLLTHEDSKNNYLQNRFQDFGDLRAVLINIILIVTVPYKYLDKKIILEHLRPTDHHWYN